MQHKLPELWQRFLAHPPRSRLLAEQAFRHRFARGIGEARKIRFQLQDEACSALAGSMNPADHPFRVCNCLRATTGNRFVILLKGPNGRARYGNLQTCGSPWTCAVCAARIGRLREAEIQLALGRHRAQGGQALMVRLAHGAAGPGCWSAAPRPRAG